MSVQRRRRGFEPAGSLPVDQLGLSRTRGADLVLTTAWRRVAGEAMARKAPALGVRRGVLEIEVSDERWFETVKSLIPRLAARLARLRPDLGVRKFRLRRESRARPDPPVALQAEPVDDSRCASHGPSPETLPEGAAQQETATRAARLEIAMERYLLRSARSRAPVRKPRPQG